MLKRIGIFLRRWWGLIAAVLAAIGVAVAYVLGRRDRAGTAVLDAAATAFKDRVAVANARAALEIKAARTTEADEKQRIEAILHDPDEERRMEAMRREMARIRGDQ